VERCSSVDWNVSFSVMWRNSFTIGGISVVYQLATVVDLWCRLFPVGNAVLLPAEDPFVEHLMASLWTLFLMNRLTQTITQFGSVFPQLSLMSVSKTTDVRVTFTHSIQLQLEPVLTLQRNPVYWLTHRDVTHQIGHWFADMLSLKQLLTLHQCCIMSTDL